MDLPHSLPALDTKWLKELRKALIDWYRRNARDLPWRSTKDPYAIWVSEVMLQQTQVATVIPFFGRFLERFPDLQTLAEAEEGEVLRYWEGLGYYRRARQLHAASQQIVLLHGGKFPSQIDQVRALPGIGRYTAGAILSFAFDQAHPILEANTQRLYARLLAFTSDVANATSQSLLWRFAEQLASARQGGLLNQSLMELGATVCVPRTPQCHLCPLTQFCKTYEKGWQDRIPIPRKKKVFEERKELVALLSDGKKRWLIQRCEKGERWAGLWDFPRFDVTMCQTPEETERLVEQQCLELFGRACALGPIVKTIRHGVTRYRITLHCHFAKWSDRNRFCSKTREVKWVTETELDELALSSTGRKICALLKFGRSQKE